MIRHPLLRCATLGIAAAIFVGCDEKPAPMTPATPSSSSETTVPPTLENAKAAAEATAADATAKAKEAGAVANDAANTVVAQAQALYDQAQAAIAKVDAASAQKYVDQLVALKDKLPADWQAKVTQLEKTLADVKAKAAALPSMPKMP